MKFIYFSFFIFLVSSCNQEPKAVDTTIIETTKEEQKITKEDIEKIKYVEYLLSADSQNAVSTWQKYQDLSTNIDLLKNANFSFFKDEEAIFKTFINDFKAETPATIKSPAIDSRITVLETKLLKLHDSANLDNIDKKVVLKDIKDLFVAFTNLNLQINKKLEFESQVIEKPY
mgnify:FL=1|jgi:uncharacterized membrane-anchored protein